MSNPVIQVNDVCRSYHIGGHRIEVLRNASLSVDPGQSVAVGGLSGAGKSTLLHILGGLSRPDSGAVCYRGNDIYAMKAGVRTRWRATRVGFVFQSYHLLPEMDVLENVMLAARTRVRYRGRGEARERALCLLREVGLSDRAHHTPLELSGGEQQRVALARALVNEPELVLADEPTGNLDRETGAHVMQCLMNLTRQQGHTLVMVTHDPQIAALCDRRLYICAGAVRDNPPSESKCES